MLLDQNVTFASVAMIASLMASALYRPPGKFVIPQKVTGTAKGVLWVHSLQQDPAGGCDGRSVHPDDIAVKY